MIRKIIIIFFIVLVFIFVFQNTQIVEVRFLTWIIAIPRALIILGALAIGLVSGWMLPRRRDKRQAPGSTDPKSGKKR